MQENRYTEAVKGNQLLVYTSQPAAQKYMATLEHVCKMYKAVVTQDKSLYPTSLQSGKNHVNATQSTSLQQEKQISRLFQALKFLDAGVSSLLNHFMPAVLFLHAFCKDGSQEVVPQTMQAMSMRLSALSCRNVHAPSTQTRCEGVMPIIHSYNPALDAVSHILSLVCLWAVIHCRFADQFVNYN